MIFILDPCTALEAGWCREDLAPLKDITETLKRVKLKWQRIQFTVLSYGTSRLSLILAKGCCSPTHACHQLMRLHVTCSTSLTRCLYCLFFSFSCHLYTNTKGPHQFDWVLGLNTLTSKNVFSNLPTQKLNTAISKQAWSSVIAKWHDIVSPESDCKWDYIATLWQTSDYSEAVMWCLSPYYVPQLETHRFCRLRHVQ